MAIQFSIFVRDGILDSIEQHIGTSAILKIRTGPAPANCDTVDSGTVLSTINLGANWASPSSGGVKAWSGTPVQDLVADNSGTAAHFRLYASDGTTCGEQGTITVTGGGGDIEVDSISFTAGQAFQITSWTWTAPNA